MKSGSIDCEDTLAETRDRLEAIIATAMDAIISVDEHQIIISFNPAAEQMFGIKAADALGTPIARFVPIRFRNDDRSHIQRFANTGATGQGTGSLGDISAVDADGVEFPVEASISTAQTSQGLISTVIMRDITERKAQQEAQLLLAREVDHRAKNILAIVTSLISLTRAPTLESYTESLSGRVSAMSRAHGLLSRGRWEGASLMEVVLGELTAYADASNFTCQGPELKLSARAVQPVAMLLHELVTNAVKFGSLSVPHGQVTLRWTVNDAMDVEMSWEESNGPPIAPPTRSGLGRNLIEKITKNQLSGRLVQSWLPTGYCATFHLPETMLQLEQDREAVIRARAPRRDEQAENTAPPPARKTPRGSFGTLLIVEDEPLLAMQMSRSLEAFGLTVLGVAGSIEEANLLLAGGNRPDVVLLDVDLAGMPVFPLARTLRRLGIPFLFCTGHEDLSYAPEFAQNRAVRKPATVLQIVRGLRDVVREAQAELTANPDS